MFGYGLWFRPPILAGVCGACVLVSVSPARCHSWLGCGGVCPLARSPPVPRHSPVFRSWPPWSPLLLPPSFWFLSFFVCCGVGVRRRVRGVISSGPSAAVWSLWATFSSWVSPVVLSVGLMGVVFGVSWLGSRPPRWSRCAALR